MQSGASCSEAIARRINTHAASGSENRDIEVAVVVTLMGTNRTLLARRDSPTGPVPVGIIEECQKSPHEYTLAARAQRAVTFAYLRVYVLRYANLWGCVHRQRNAPRIESGCLMN